MDFAKKVLEKYGWKEGDGLGKHSDGMVAPLKASLKFDSSGLGVDRAQEFNNHWWERVFNEAANNVQITKDGDKVAVQLKNEDSVEITTKDYSVRELKKKSKGKSYDNFLKHSTLTSKGTELENEEKQEIDTFQPVRQLTDEELFAACGGRTAHKGARHGLKLSGKLSRIEAQERELLAKMQGAEAVRTNNEMPDSFVSKKKKKKSKKEKPENNYFESLAVEETKDDLTNAEESWTLVKPKKSKSVSSKKAAEILLPDSSELVKLSKKERKKKAREERELAGLIDSISIENESKSKSLLSLSESSKAISKSKKNKGKKKEKTICSEDAEWKTYREGATDEPLDRVEFLEEANQRHSEDIPKTESTHKVKKGGVQKHLKEHKKKAKKLKKTIADVTNILENSELI